MKKNRNIKIFTLAAQGIGISGSDRIFIELTRRWQKSADIEIITWKEGVAMISNQNLKNNKNLKITSLKILFQNVTYLNYFTRIINSIFYALNLKIDNSENVILYNASEFWMDSLPCVILKIKYPKIKWVATWYQTAPNPLKGFTEKEREDKHYFKASLYWFAQLPVYYFNKYFADKIIINNESERVRYPSKNKSNDLIVLIGAVPINIIENYKKKNTTRNNKITKKYDGVFQGRFHPQKGVSELIDIWAKVVKKNPSAKLAMIGDGPEMKVVKKKISKHKLSNNIDVFGYVFDGDQKFKIFSESKIVLHPAYYDSGGMAAAEAMAFGLPCIGFDLPSYKSYYPKGMLKAKDEKDFAKLILKLIDDTKMRNKIGKEAKEMIYKKYSWDMRADEILKKIL